MPHPELSIIVPVVDEAEALPRLFAALRAQRGLRFEVIVVDGGSSDASTVIAQAHGASVIRSAAGRGRQMNCGARAARADWLLFLHADTRPQQARQLADALALLCAQNHVHIAGHFQLEFERDGSGNRLLYRYMQEKTASHRRYTINGDQGLMLSSQWFWQLGGFDESMGFLEDQRIAMQIERHGRWLLLPGCFVTSARRFEVEGAKTRYILMAIIMAMYAIDQKQFFARARNVYQTQSDTGRLLLTPYFRLLRQLMREQGVRQSLYQWVQVGYFVVAESWQLFFVLDVALRPLLGANRYPCTRFHDRVFAPLTHHRVGAWITAGLVFVYTMGVLAPWYRWREARLLKAC